MPKELEKHLPSLNATERATLFGDITSVTTLSYDDPIRKGVIDGTSFPPFPTPHKQTTDMHFP